MRHSTLSPRIVLRNSYPDLTSYQEADRLDRVLPSRAHHMKAPLATEMLLVYSNISKADRLIPTTMGTIVASYPSKTYHDILQWACVKKLVSRPEPAQSTRRRDLETNAFRERQLPEMNNI